MFQLSEDYIGSKCVVRTLANVVLLTGEISKTNDEFIEIINPRDKVPLQKANLIVRIKISKKGQEPIFLVGVSYISCHEFLRISDVESVAEFEKRAFFRVNTYLPATFKIKTSSNNKDKLIHKVTIENISLGGLFFTYNLNFEIDDCLEFEFYIDDILMNFECFVCRKTTDEAEKGYEKTEDAEKLDAITQPIFYYGCKFNDCSDKQIDLLCKFIFEQQREEIRKRREMQE